MSVKHGKLTELDSALAAGRIDLFIGSASYEERCLSVPAHLDLSRVESAIVGINFTYHDAVDANFGRLRDTFEQKLVQLPLRSDDPITSADRIAAVVGAALVGGPKRIVADITTFTRESLLMLLRYLRGNLRPQDSIEFVYAHA